MPQFDNTALGREPVSIIHYIRPVDIVSDGPTRTKKLYYAM